MKNILIALSCSAALSATAQISTPQPSPAATVKQTVGLTEIEINYSRPSKNDRVIFGDLVPMDEMWRTGANKNTILSTDKMMLFGKDTLQPGSYAIFTKPMKSGWEVYFYTDTENWGTPEAWDAAKVAVKTMATVKTMADVTESFTISVENLSGTGANLVFSWDKTKAVVAFKVATETQVMSSIEKTMAGPSANDYYKAAEYYLNEKKDMKQALEWVNKAIAMQEKAPFWMLRRKSLIQAELGDYKGAIETAKLSLEGAKAANYDNYIKMNEASIAEWSKKK